MMFRVRLVVAVLLVSIRLAAGPISYTVRDLGTLGGNAAATSVNASGQTAGTRNDIHATSFAFSSGTNLTPAGADGALGAAINKAGQIAGTTYFNGTPFGTIWSGSAATYLESGSYAMGINDTGQVTGMAGGHAFLLTQGVMRDLGVLPGGDWSSGYGLNQAGTVVGYGSARDGSFKGLLWDGSAAPSVLGTLGGRNSYAMAINDAGQIAGSAQTGSGYLHAAVWRGSGAIDLGTLGGLCSGAYGIAPDGSVVGFSTDAAGNSRAFLYRFGRLFDLNSLIAGSGWFLSAAYGINAAGQIAGTGLFDGVEHAILLNPIALTMAASFSAVTPVPEPGTWVLVSIGLAFILRRR